MKKCLADEMARVFGEIILNDCMRSCICGSLLGTLDQHSLGWGIVL